MSRCLFSLLHHRILFCLDCFSAIVRRRPCELNNVCALTTTTITESRAKVWCGKMHSRQINPLEVKTNMHFMCGSRNFCQGAVQTQLTTFLLLFFCPQLILQRGSNGLFQKKTIMSQGVRKGPTYSRGSRISYSYGNL